MAEERPRILVVEDGFVVAHGVCESLRAAGFHAEAAPDGAAARVMAAAWRPHVAVVDVALRERFDGLEIARWLVREHGVRIVFQSAYEPAILPLAERALFDEAAHGFVAKPPEPAALVAAVRAALGEC